ncbi:MAG TPA: hypothetical protein VG944_01690 [Fimbriimonas sp.]|nr:hypothetical protein [Fimbriimonas sp.]
MPRESAKKILIYGVTGSGKTTFAAKLSERTGIAWHSVDDLTWLPGWIQVPDEEQEEKIKAICEGPSWILDTAYAKWHQIPLSRAELIVALDYPRWLSFRRLLVRCIKRLFDGKTVCNGNRESLRNVLSKNSLLLWHIRSWPRKRERVEGWCRSGLPVKRFRHPRDAERWLQSLMRD